MIYESVYLRFYMYTLLQLSLTYERFTWIQKNAEKLTRNTGFGPRIMAKYLLDFLGLWVLCFFWPVDNFLGFKLTFSVIVLSFR